MGKGKDELVERLARRKFGKCIKTVSEWSHNEKKDKKTNWMRQALEEWLRMTTCDSTWRLPSHKDPSPGLVQILPIREPSRELQSRRERQRRWMHRRGSKGEGEHSYR